MNSQYIGTALFGICAAAIAIAVSSFKLDYRYCPNPSAPVAALCQPLASTGGAAVARSEAMQVGLLLPYLQPKPEPEMRFAQNRPSADDWQ
jgi:hypothetical protein